MWLHVRPGDFEVGVARLNNAQLRIMVSRLAAFRLEAEITADVAILPEAFLLPRVGTKVSAAIGPTP